MWLVHIIAFVVFSLLAVLFLIVMGSHTKETSGKWYPRSAEERVGYRAACPVAVISDPQVLEHWGGKLSTTQQMETDRLIHVFTGA